MVGEYKREIKMLLLASWHLLFIVSYCDNICSVSFLKDMVA